VPTIIRSVREEQRHLSAELRAQHKTWAETASIFVQRYNVNMRTALRLVRGWSQRDVADRWNSRWPDDQKTFKNFSYWEIWPAASGYAPSLAVLAKLAELYECRMADLISDCADFRTRDPICGWVLKVRGDLPEEFHRFLDLEVALVARRNFETLLVPGLLQTTEYARALIAGIHPGLAEDEVERRVAARITRQQILTRTTPPHLHVILDAGLLERPVGTPVVMRNQLRRLAEATGAPHITIQVLPKSVGASPALEGPFSILTLPEPIPDVGYSEGPGRAVYIEDRDDVRAYTLRFDLLTEQSLSQTDSVKLITNAAKDYE